MRAFKGLELRFLRGTREQVVDWLKKGEAEIAVAGPLGESWDRLDAWPLFTERFSLAVSAQHPLADRKSIDITELVKERVLIRTYCELASEFTDFFKDRQLQLGICHKMGAEPDLVALIEANLGVGMLPDSAGKSDLLRVIDVEGLDFKRTIYLYGVAGRQRSAAASALIRLMRAGDWSSHAAA